MIPLETLSLFFATAAALAMVPGPDNIFVLTQSAVHGRMAGILVTLGLCTGLLVHTAAVSLGVAVLFQTSAVAFNALKIAGALYLLYLAWQAFRAGAADFTPDGVSTSWRGLYLRGVIMNITNPKVAIFFLAFLPQFADPSLGSISVQMLILGGVFIVAALLIFSSIAWTAGFLGERIKGSTRAQTVINRLAGMVFVSLAIKLAVTER